MPSDGRGLSRVLWRPSPASHSARSGRPRCDIAKTDENAYRFTMAIVGFGPENVEVTNTAQLLVTGRKQA